jgi:two-component sensor histidine kinase
MGDPVRILYIDDDPALVRLAEKQLGRRGYEIIHAEDAESGRARLEEGGIDAVILDHYLRAGTGLDFMIAIRERFENIPVVYVTGSSEARVAVEALKAGAADYVIKTVGEEFMPLLANALGQALENAALKRAKEQGDREIRLAKERAEVLLSEVNHRVGNSLALAAALIRLQMSSTADDEVKAALSETQARITAIAGIHRRLYTSDDVRHVDMGAYLSTLLSELSASMQGQGTNVRLAPRVEPLSIPTDRAVSLGMIVTELVTNAFKYAYGENGGEVRVEFARIDGDTALLSVEDDGIGWRGEGPARGTGLGSKIISAMATSLGAALEYAARERGTRAEMRFRMVEAPA